jgi:hypothetical protein
MERERAGGGAHKSFKRQRARFISFPFCSFCTRRAAELKRKGGSKRTFCASAAAVAPFFLQPLESMFHHPGAQAAGLGDLTFSNMVKGNSKKLLGCIPLCSKFQLKIR